MVSLVERGHLDRVSVRFLRKLFAALDASLTAEVGWRGASLDRLLDEEHAGLVELVAGLLRDLGWLVEVEVTYSEYGERGSYDILAFHPATRSLLVIEVKTDLVAAEATLRKLDEKTRLGRKVVKDRFGWTAATVSRLLVLPATSTARRRVARHATLFGAAFEVRTAAFQRWMLQPTGQVSALWFVAERDRRVAIRRRPTPERVRLHGSRPNNPRVAA
jgi:hypothetical protein